MNKHLIFIFLFALSCQPQDNYKEWQVLGKLKTKPANEIKTSKLWIGGEVLDRDLCDYDAYKEYLGELGAKKIRLQSGWAKTEKVKGEYDFSWLDLIVNDAISRGLQPWIQISYGNLLYPGGGGISLSGGLPTSDVALEAWSNYTKALVNRYKNIVNEWEIWNEADHPNNRDFGSDEYTYARLFIKTFEAIKSVQPEARIVAFSLAGVGRTEFVDVFFKYLEEHGNVNWVDVITFHGYPENPDAGFDNVTRLIETATKYNPNIEFWQGETGCPSTLGSTGALKNHAWTEHTQAKWDMRRALAHIGRGYNFSLFLISEFIYNDAQRKGLNTKGILKIDENDFSIKYPKPAYFAYQNLCTVFGRELDIVNNLHYKADTDSSMSVFAWKDKKGNPIVAYWKDDEIPQDKDFFFDLTLEMKGIRFKEPVLLNPFNGEVKLIPKEILTNENGNTIFTGIPAWDSPMIIMEKELIEIKPQ